MANGRLSVGIGKKGKASPHAMYIAREGKYAKPDDDLEKLEFVGVGNMPEWAQDKPNFFWKMSDEHERMNGSVYREHVISLPRELTPDQRHELIKSWIKQEIGERHAYQYAIHNPPAADGGEQPHCHLMFCERVIDGIERAPDEYFKRYNKKNPEKGGAKKANTGLPPAERRANLLAQRERWEQMCNQHLALASSHARINMKSLKAQGIEREPINIPMRHFKLPSVIDNYTNWLKAKAEHDSALQEKSSINIRAEIDRLTQKPPKYDWIEDVIEQMNDDENVSHYLALPFLSRHKDTHIMSQDDDPSDPINAQKFNAKQLEKIEKWASSNGLNLLDSDDIRSNMRRVYKFFNDIDNVANNQQIIDLMHNPSLHREQTQQATQRIDTDFVVEQSQVNHTNIQRPKLN